MAFDQSVIQWVDDPGIQIAEHSFQIDQTADEKPEHGQHSHQARNDQEHDAEIPAPVFKRPGGDQIPDHNGDKGKSKTVNKAVKEISPGDTFVTGGVFRGDTDHFVVEVLPSPGTGDRFLFSLSVGAAVEHAFQVEQLFGGQF